MRKRNLIYVLSCTFNMDLVFWIIIDNLFMSKVKNFSASDIVLVTMVGLSISLMLYPISNFIIKRVRSRTSNIIASVCNCIAIIMFVFCRTIYGFIIAQTIYSLSSGFFKAVNVILKNNLNEDGKLDDFVKWQSRGHLGYSINTMIASLVSGFLFNINPYVPLAICLSYSIIGLILSLIYDDNTAKQTEKPAEIKLFSLFKNRIMLLLMLINIFGVGTYAFLQSQSTLLIQYVFEEAEIDLAKISIMVSMIVLGSRIVRILSNLIFNKIYNKVNKKPYILIAISFVILSSNLLLAFGGILTSHYIIKIVLITIGFYLILFIRDMMMTTQNKIITANFSGQGEKQVFILTDFFSKLGKIICNAVALFLLGFMPLNLIFSLILVFTTIQLLVAFPLSKYLQ